MSRGKWPVIVIVSVAAALAGGVLGYWAALPGEPNDPRSSIASPAAREAPLSERKVLYWHDPMVPGAKFDKPGKSPFMDMALVPVYADESGGASVRVSAAVAQNLGIRLGKVQSRQLRHRLDAVGSVAFDQRRLQVVQARVAGYVERLYVKAPQELVRRGQPLADIVAPEWLAAQREYLALLDDDAVVSHSIRDAARQRLTVLGVPAAAIEHIERTRQVSAATTLSAPIDGVVAELAVRQGSAFAAGEALLRLNGLATVWVDAQIPEAQVSLISVGSSAEARSVAWPGATFGGRVFALLPQIDTQTRTMSARLAIDNPQRKLSPGMFVSLVITGPAGEPQLVVPSEAVISTGRRSVVIVARDAESFAAVDVKMGMERDGVSTILAGLALGESVVLSGQFLIDSEASLKATIDRLATGAATSAPAERMSIEPQSVERMPTEPGSAEQVRP